VVSIWMAPNGTITSEPSKMYDLRTEKPRICYAFGATRRIRTDDPLTTILCARPAAIGSGELTGGSGGQP
jgi:hypothetical protein